MSHIEVIKSGLEFKKREAKKTKEGIELPVDSVLQRSFVWAIIGRPESGKSYFMENVIADDRFFGKKFTRLLVMSPSVIKGLDLDKDNHIQIWDTDWIDKNLNSFKPLALKKYINIIIIIDDFITEINNYAKCEKLYPLITNRRHYYDDAHGV